MEALACQALQKAGDALQSVIIDRVMTYLSDVKNYEQNMISLCEILEKLCVERKDFDDKVKSGKVKLEILTYKAVHWLGEVQDFTKHKEMKKLMINDMGIARAMLRLMKDADLKMLVEEDGEMHELVLKVMKDYAKRRKACNGEVCNGEVLLAADEQKDKEVGQVLEKLMEETMDEVKALMQNDMYLAVAALHLLENHMVNFERLTEKDKEMADVITKAREMSLKEEWLSRDNHLSVLVHENNLREKVTNLLKPMEEVILNEELLKAFPENLSLGMEAMGFIIGNSRGQKAELIKADNTSNHRTCCVISYSYFSDRHDMSVAAKDMLDVANAIIGRKPGDQDLTRPMRKEEMLSMPTNFIGLKSINELLVRIVGALASSDVLAVGVIGMGGSGKTTLAKEIVRSKANGIFDRTVMVVLTSQSPNMEWIQDQIANGLELPLHNVHGTPEKATHIYNKLRLGEKSEGGKDDNNSKKTLIVLVNIWKEIDLLQIGIPRDCKLLLTSGEREVCKAMNVQDANIFEVGLLSDDEAKNLFKFQIQKELTGEYNSVADKLLEKCRGLPLSIVTTANFVKGKELRLWKQYADELDKPIPCQMTGVHHEAFSILRTSYEAMASKEKKSYFLLACLSPVGSNISIDNLMRYGIGLDLFQHVNKLSEAISRARIWAEELLSSSMLQKGDSNEYVKIHDVVREFIMSFASNGLNTDGQMFLVDAIPRWICEETFNKYTGISLLAQVNFARLSGVKADLLQILLLKGNENHSSYLESNFFQGMTNLKVLEMLFMNFEKGLPESIGKLKVLKTLHLVDCKLGDIKLIGELGSLLVLSLRGSTLEALPDEIGKLYKLRLLDMSKCQCKEPRISANVIARLPLLEGLYLVDSSFTEWAVMDGTSNDTGVSNGADIEDLTKLDFLNVLEIHMRGLIYLPICDQFVKNLDKFQIIVGQEGFKLQPCQRGLMVSEVDVSQELKKDNCLKALLKKADFLALKMTTVKNIVPELDKEGYRDLTRLELSNISSISRVCEGKAPTQLFLNLRHLEVSQLANLKELLPLNPLPHNLTTLDVRSVGVSASKEANGNSQFFHGLVFQIDCAFSHA
ncbi:disease resistance protein At4g27190-like [Silene latifolia]|uniref:disease resistance protein At4g27190-like n=1 Tax=Silene latifolia TaxID=37657 RepID=UPI003D773055